jgi:hypothetical protein
MSVKGSFWADKGKRSWGGVDLHMEGSRGPVVIVVPSAGALWDLVLDTLNTSEGGAHGGSSAPIVTKDPNQWVSLPGLGC